MELLFEHLAVFALLFVQKLRQTLKMLFVPRGTGFFFKKRGSAESILISNVTQRNPRHAKFKSHSFFKCEYPVTLEE